MAEMVICFLFSTYIELETSVWACSFAIKFFVLVIDEGNHGGLTVTYGLVNFNRTPISELFEKNYHEHYKEINPAIK